MSSLTKNKKALIATLLVLGFAVASSTIAMPTAAFASSDYKDKHSDYNYYSHDGKDGGRNHDDKGYNYYSDDHNDYKSGHDRNHDHYYYTSDHQGGDHGKNYHYKHYYDNGCDNCYNCDNSDCCDNGCDNGCDN
jgi:hypothetical protein